MLLKKASRFLMTVIFVSVLVGCGLDTERNVAQEMQDNPRNFTAEDFMPISEGLEEFKVWYISDSNLVRDSIVTSILVSDGGELTYYDLNQDVDGKEELTMEQAASMSEKEAIEFAVRNSKENYEKLISENTVILSREEFDRYIEEDTLYGLLTKSDSVSPENQYQLDHYTALKPIREDVVVEIEGDYSIPSNAYQLDIQLEDTGNYTEHMILNLPEANIDLVGGASTHIGLMRFYLEFLYYGMEAPDLRRDNPEEYVIRKQHFADKLSENGQFKSDSKYEEFHPQTFVPNPAKWGQEDKVIRFNSSSIRQELFGQTFAGVGAGEGKSITTKVDDSFVGFRLDSPDTKQKNVTVEGK